MKSSCYVQLLKNSKHHLLTLQLILIEESYWHQIIGNEIYYNAVHKIGLGENLQAKNRLKHFLNGNIEF